MQLLAGLQGEDGEQIEKTYLRNVAVKKTKNHYMDKLRNKVEIKSMSPNIIHTICVHLYKFKTRKPKK